MSARKSEQFSQEVQLQFDCGIVSGIVGGYYFNEDTNERATVPLAFPPSPPVIGSLLAGGPGIRDLQVSQLEDRLAGRVRRSDLVEPAEGLELSGGLRYTVGSQDLSGHGVQPVPGDAARSRTRCRRWRPARRAAVHLQPPVQRDILGADRLGERPVSLDRLRSAPMPPMPAASSRAASTPATMPPPAGNRAGAVRRGKRRRATRSARRPISGGCASIWPHSRPTTTISS